MATSFRTICLIICAVLSTGCIEEYAARSVIRAPNRGGDPFPKSMNLWHMVDWARFVSVGPPDAQIAFRVIEPKEIRVWTSLDDALPTLPDDAEWIAAQWSSEEELGTRWRTPLVFRSRVDDRSYIVHEQYRDPEALALHETSPHGEL